jgi:RNA polymerase sigma-70 factor (ECF subfamily)
MRGFEHIGRFQGGSAFRTWLFSIAYREFLQARRRAGAAGRLIERLSEPEAVQDGGEPGAAVDLQRALQVLDEAERAAVLLCDACGMSHSEAAEAMSAPLGSVKTYVQRARAKMQAALTSQAREERHDR